MSKTNPRAVLVDVAKRDLWIRETSRNQGLGIERYWPATTYPAGYKNREPYCAAAVCYWIAEAMRRGHELGLTEATRPKDAAVRHMVAWAQRPTSGCKLFAPRDGLYFPQAGDIVYFQFFGAIAPNHVGIVEDYTGSTVKTIEANTDASGGREGDGVYRRSRTLAGCTGFIRVAWRAALP